MTTKIIDIYPGEIRNLRFQIQGLVDGSWFLYSGLDTARLDVRQVGIESGGGQPPMLASSPPQNVAFLTSLVWPVTIYSGTGKISFVAEAYDEDPTNSDTGVLCYLHFRLQLRAGGGNNPPVVQNCVDEHPIHPLVVGDRIFDCVGNVWTDIGPYVPPVDEDPDLSAQWGNNDDGIYTLDAIHPNIWVLENTCRTLYWYWQLASGGKTDIPSSSVQFSSTDLPVWVWTGNGELSSFTINEGGTSCTYVEIGYYQANFSSAYVYSESFPSSIEVRDNPHFPQSVVRKSQTLGNLTTVTLLPGFYFSTEEISPGVKHLIVVADTD